MGNLLPMRTEFRDMSGLKRAQWMLGIVVFGLVVSGVTVWPAVPELKMAVHIV